MSVIAKVESLATLDNIQFLLHVNQSSTLQLINGISNDLLKLFKYFNSTAIFTPFFIPPFGKVSIKFDLYLKDDELFVLTSEISPSLLCML